MYGFNNINVKVASNLFKDLRIGATSPMVHTLEHFEAFCLSRVSKGVTFFSAIT